MTTRVNRTDSKVDCLLLTSLAGGGDPERSTSPPWKYRARNEPPQDATDARPQTLPPPRPTTTFAPGRDSTAIAPASTTSAPPVARAPVVRPHASSEPLKILMSPEILRTVKRTISDNIPKTARLKKREPMQPPQMTVVILPPPPLTPIPQTSGLIPPPSPPPMP